MRTIRIAVVALAVLLPGPPGASAQNLTFSLLERYLESLREQAGIPGMSAAVVQNGSVVWAQGFGRQNIEEALAASGDTPYPIGQLTQTLASTLLLRKCVDESHLEVTDPVIRWASNYAEPQTTVAHLLAHAAPGGGYRHNPPRFAALTTVIGECASRVYRKLVSDELFERLGMAQSVPGADLAASSNQDRRHFSASQLERYEATLRRMAIPYRVDSRGRATRSDFSASSFDASTGVVASVLDLARFDAALGAGALLDRDTLRLAWTRVTVGGTALPTGLGWFVQSYNGEPLVWQFGLLKDAYSSLILKLPNRNVTFILLANSDGLSAPFGLENGDVTTSVFAKLFLRLLFN